MKNYLVALLSIIVVQLSMGQIVTDRPNQTESAVSVPKASLQIESGLSISYTEIYYKSHRQVLLPTNLIRYGLTDRLELRVINQLEFNTWGSKNWQGISDLQLGAKIELWSKENQNLAFIGHVIFPLGSTEITKDDFAVLGKLSYSHNLSDKNSLGYNLGLYMSPVDLGATYTICLTTAVNDKVNVYVEPFGEINDSDGFVFNIDSGLTYLVFDHVQLDFSFGLGVNNKMNYTALGCSWLFN